MVFIHRYMGLGRFKGFHHIVYLSHKIPWAAPLLLVEVIALNRVFLIFLFKTMVKQGESVAL